MAAHSSPAPNKQMSVPTIDTFGCARVHPFGNGKPQKRAGPATRERRKPWRRQSKTCTDTTSQTPQAKEGEQLQASVPVASSAAWLFGQPAFYAAGEGRFGESTAEFRPLRFQHHADFGAQDFRSCPPDLSLAAGSADNLMRW
jgi:hypothetical protein